jgi:hypothetical protein
LFQRSPKQARARILIFCVKEGTSLQLKPQTTDKY